jgi:class 3 adenylate cyclase
VVSNQTIIVVDIASFTRPTRTMWHQRVVLECLDKVLYIAFSEAGVELDTCVVKDRGDGKLILIPPGMDNARLADRLPGRLVAWLRRHNAVHSSEAQFKLRVALHNGEVQQHGQDVLGAAVNLTFRIVDAPEAKSMLRLTPCVLALIASDDFYKNVISQDPATDSSSYRQLSVRDNETSVVAWLRALDDASPARGTARHTDNPPVLDLVPTEERQRLYDWLIPITLPNLRALVNRAAGPGRPSGGRFADAWEAFSYLEEFNANPDGFPPALMFVELVAGEEAARDVRARLTGWNDDQVRRLGLESQLRERREAMSPIPPDPLLYLMIVVEPDGIDHHNRYRVSHWRQDDATVWPPARGDTHVVTFGDLERCVDELVVSAERAWSGHTGSVALEFVLPRALLNMPVHRWHKEHDSGDPRPLCLDYPIVVRSLERMQASHWHRMWHQRWNLLMTDQSAVKVHFAQSTETTERHGIDVILMSDLRYVLMVLTTAPPPQPKLASDELTAALRSGLPALVWHTDASSEVVHETVTQLLEGGGLGGLPKRAQASRRAALQESRAPSDVNMICGLVVLWDDPDRLVVLDQLSDQPPDPPPEGDIADERGRVSQRGIT